eukprot:529357_1
MSATLHSLSYSEVILITANYVSTVNIAVNVRKLVHGSQTSGDKVIDTYKLIGYPMDEPTRKSPGIGKAPLSIAITEYHVMLLYPNRFVVLNHLSEEIMMDDSTFPRDRSVGKFVAFAHDPSNNTNWCIGQNAIFQVLVEDEDCDIWKIFLEQGNFSEAFVHCRGIAQEEIVLNHEADFYFKNGSYSLAAEKYAKSSNRSFEEVTLKFFSSKCS